MAKAKYYDGSTWQELETSANKVTITDSDNKITATEVEGALSEIVDEIDILNTNQGILSSLTTTEKTNLVGAINELHSDAETFKSDTIYQTPTIVSQQIRITRQSDTKRLYFKLASDLTGGAITISLDDGVTSLPLKDIDDVAITSLDKGYYEVIDNTSFFTLRPRGGDDVGFFGKYVGNTVWDTTYTPTVLPENATPAWVKTLTSGNPTISTNGTVLSVVPIASAADNVEWKRTEASIDASKTKILEVKAKIGAGNANAIITIAITDGTRWAQVQANGAGVIQYYNGSTYVSIATGQVVTSNFTLRLELNNSTGLRVYFNGTQIGTTITYISLATDSTKYFKFQCYSATTTTPMYIYYVKYILAFETPDLTLISKVSQNSYIYSNEDVQLGTITYSADLTTSAQAISGGDNASYPKANAFNNDSATTRWISSQIALTGVAYIGQDFGVGITKCIRKITILQGNTTNAISSVKVQASNDGETWTDVQTITPDINILTIQTFLLNFNILPARYWRLLANASTAGSASWGINEIEMMEIATGQLIPSINNAYAESQLIATIEGELKTYGTALKRYSGVVSKKAKGWS